MNEGIEFEGYTPKKLNGIVDSERAMVQLKKSFEACFARRMEAVINEDTSATSIPFGLQCILCFLFQFLTTFQKLFLFLSGIKTFENLT